MEKARVSEETADRSAGIHWQTLSFEVSFITLLHRWETIVQLYIYIGYLSLRVLT